MKKILILSLFAISSSSFAADPRISGNWKECARTDNGQGQQSTYTIMTFRDDMSGNDSETMYSGADCTGTVMYSKNTAFSYSILSADAATALTQIAYPAASVPENEVIAYKSLWTFQSPTAAKLRLVSATVKVNGQPVEAPADLVAQIREISVTK